VIVTGNVACADRPRPATVLTSKPSAPVTQGRTMKRIACVVVGLAVAASSSGCCCLGALFGHGGGYGYGGGNCAPCAAPAGGCYTGQCGYGPGVAPYQMGPTGMVAPLGTTAMVPYAAPVYASINPVPIY
jgi:hypothetical protein